MMKKSGPGEEVPESLLKGTLEEHSQRPGDTGHGGDLVHGRLFYPIDGAEPADEHPLAFGTDTGDQIKGGAKTALATQIPVIGDGETVSLVTNPLHQVEGLGVSGQDDRLRSVGYI